MWGIQFSQNILKLLKIKGEKEIMKDKIIGIIIGVISGFLIFKSMLNMILETLILFEGRKEIYILIALTLHIIDIILIILVCINYKKWRKGIEIAIIVISILSFIVPVRKEEEWRNIEEHPQTFFGSGMGDTFEKYEMYYNIYSTIIKENATGELRRGPC